MAKSKDGCKRKPPQQLGACLRPSAMERWVLEREGIEQPVILPLPALMQGQVFSQSLKPLLKVAETDLQKQLQEGSFCRTGYAADLGFLLWLQSLYGILQASFSDDWLFQGQFLPQIPYKANKNVASLILLCIHSKLHSKGTQNLSLLFHCYQINVLNTACPFQLWYPKSWATAVFFKAVKCGTPYQGTDKILKSIFLYFYCVVCTLPKLWSLITLTAKVKLSDKAGTPTVGM